MPPVKKGARRERPGVDGPKRHDQALFKPFVKKVKQLFRIKGHSSNLGKDSKDSEGSSEKSEE